MAIEKEHHSAAYGRKPRGGPDVPEEVCVRRSLCRGREGCRRRARLAPTPKTIVCGIWLDRRDLAAESLGASAPKLVPKSFCHKLSCFLILAEDLRRCVAYLYGLCDVSCSACLQTAGRVTCADVRVGRPAGGEVGRCGLPCLCLAVFGLCKFVPGSAIFCL